MMISEGKISEGYNAVVIVFKVEIAHQSERVSASPLNNVKFFTERSQYCIPERETGISGEAGFFL